MIRPIIIFIGVVFIAIGFIFNLGLPLKFIGICWVLISIISLFFGNKTKEATMEELLKKGILNEKNKQIPKDYSQGSDYQQKLTFEQESWSSNLKKAARDEAEENRIKTEKKYKMLRHFLPRVIKDIKGRPIEKEGENVLLNEDIDMMMKNISEKAAELGLSFNAEAYGDLMKKYLPEYQKANIQHLEKEFLGYLEENKEKVHTAELNEKLNMILGLGEKTGMRIQGIPLTQEKAYQYYQSHARTESIANIEKNYRKIIIEGVPYKATATGRKYLNTDQSELLRNKGYDFFLNGKFERSGIMSSASAVDINSTPHQFFSCIGVMYKDGKAFDANAEDVTSQSKGSARVAQLVGGPALEKPVEDRIKDTLASETGRYNEFIIEGERPVGIYFIKEWIQLWREKKSNVESEKKEFPEILRDLAQTAKEKRVPLYEFKTGTGNNGFTEIQDVELYLGGPYELKRRLASEKKETLGQKAIKQAEGTALATLS